MLVGRDNGKGCEWDFVDDVLLNYSELCLGLAGDEEAGLFADIDVAVFLDLGLDEFL
jgi:hypothetical protein